MTPKINILEIYHQIVSVHFNTKKIYGRLDLYKASCLTSMGLCASLIPSITELVRAASKGKPTQQSELQASEAPHFLFCSPAIKPENWHGLPEQRAYRPDQDRLDAWSSSRRRSSPRTPPRGSRRQGDRPTRAAGHKSVPRRGPTSSAWSPWTACQCSLPRPNLGRHWISFIPSWSYWGQWYIQNGTAAKEYKKCQKKEIATFQEYNCFTHLCIKNCQWVKAGTNK